MARPKKVKKELVVSKHYANFFPLFLFLIQLSGVTFLGALLFIAITYLHGINFLFIEEQGRNLHIILAPFSFIYLAGQGILCFRLMRNIKTSIVKVFHTLLHAMSLLFGVLGVYTMWNGKEHPYTEYGVYQNVKRLVPKESYTPFHVDGITHFPSLHSYIGYLAVGLNFFMFIMGTILHLTALELRYKHLLVGMHGTLGIFTVICSSIAACCGILSLMNNEKYFFFGRHKDFESEFAVGYYCILALSIFSWLILYVIMNPHFEWTPIGPV